MRKIADRGSLDYAKRNWVRAAGGTSGGAYVDVVNLTGRGWIMYVSGRQNGGSCNIRFIVDGVTSTGAQFSRDVSTSGGYSRVSTGIYNIPFRFETGCQVQCLYGSVEVFYALD